MGNVTTSGIWTPDEEDTVEPDIYLALMADSIEQGIGKRLGYQEQFISASIHLPFGENYPLESAQRIPYQITTASYNNGLVVQDGIITIDVDGLYFLTSRVTFEHPQHKLVTLEIRETPSNTLARGHGSSVDFGVIREDGLQETVGYITVSEVRRLYKGDQVFCCLLKHGDQTKHLEARAIGDIDSNNFSVTLLKPFPPQ